MVRKYLFNCTVVSLWLCGSVMAFEAGKPVTLVLDEAGAFPFPKNIFGMQEEVFTAPYVADHLHKAIRALGVNTFRYPCGTPSDWLAWDNIENGYWPSDFEKKRIKLTPDGFIDFCKRIGFEPIITVNTNLVGVHDEANRINPTRVESIRRGAKYAAQWVEHTNIKNKAGVKFWEIGNEVWVWMKENEYPVYVREFSRAMRKVDPSIKIIACGSTHDMEFNPVWMKFPNDPQWKSRDVHKTNARKWTRMLLKNANGYFDYLAPHNYIDGDSVDPVANGKSLFANIDATEAIYRDQIAMIKEAKSPARLAVTEWMVNWHFLPDMKREQKDRKNLSEENYNKLTFANSPLHLFISVLGSADFLGKMIATGYVDIAIAHTETFCVGLVWNNEAQKVVDPMISKPAGVAIEFWSAMKDQNVIPVKLGNVPTYKSEANYAGKKNVEVPCLTAYSTADGKKRLNIVLINRSPDKTFAVTLPTTFCNQKAVRVTEYAVEADSWAASIWPATKDRSLYPFKKVRRNLDVKSLNPYQARPCKLVRLEIDF
jgi:alpha-L-arabinofuranosidase